MPAFWPSLCAFLRGVVEHRRVPNGPRYGWPLDRYYGAGQRWARRVLRRPS